MGEEAEYGRIMNEHRKERGEDRRGIAKKDIREAGQLAAKHGLRFQMFQNGNQYNISNSEWTIQIYPGNRRVYSPQGKRGPYLKIKEWNAIGFVLAAIETLQKGGDE